MSVLSGVSASNVREYRRRARDAYFKSSHFKDNLRFPTLEELKRWTPQKTWDVYSKRNGGQTLLAVIDCTYVWLEQPSQKGAKGMSRKVASPDQYSGQPFIKYLTVVAPNGRLVFSFGPFAAATSDNDILGTCLANNAGLRDYLNLAGDKGVLIADRGFNHLEQVFEKHGLKLSFRIPGWTDADGVFSARDVKTQYEITEERAVVEQFHAVMRRYRKWQLSSSLSTLAPSKKTNQSPLHIDFLCTLALANYCYKPPRASE